MAMHEKNESRSDPRDGAFDPSLPGPDDRIGQESRVMPGGSETVLLVEDDQPVLLIISRLLRRLGYTVIEASGGPGALDRAGRCEGPVHLLLTDVVMPGMNGPQLAGELRGLRPGLKVLYVTGFTGDELQRQGMDTGEADVLMKPFRAAELARRVRAALDRPLSQP
jgi:DNA-binding response OmpR family regulator